MRLRLSLLILVLAQAALFVEGRAQTPVPSCPILSVNCPTDLVTTLAPVKVSVVVTGGESLNLRYHWEVTGGTITAGQGTTEITVDTMGHDGADMMATVEVEGLPEGCDRVESCTVGTIYDPPPHRLFDCYENLGSAREDESLAQFAEVLRQEWGRPQGYVFYYGPRGVDKRLERARKVLVSKFGIDPTRITGVNAGYSKKFAAQLWIRPMEASEPQPSTPFYCPRP